MKFNIQLTITHPEPEVETVEEIAFLKKQHEILLQLKEISKRIHICANLMEDIIFKMN